METEEIEKLNKILSTLDVNNQAVFVKSITREISDNDKKKLLWLIEGQVLSQSELASLIKISQDDNTLKIVVEMGGSRNLQWQSLGKYITNEF